MWLELLRQVANATTARTFGSDTLVIAQVAQFLCLGEFGDTFLPGKHTLATDNIPILTKLASWKYGFKIVEPKTFLREVAGSDHNFRLDEFADTMRSRIVSLFTDAIASAKIPVLDVASRYTELGDALLPTINPAVTAKYGLAGGSATPTAAAEAEG